MRPYPFPPFPSVPIPSHTRTIPGGGRGMGQPSSPEGGENPNQILEDLQHHHYNMTVLDRNHSREDLQGKPPSHEFGD